MFYIVNMWYIGDFFSQIKTKQKKRRYGLFLSIDTWMSSTISVIYADNNDGIR